MLHVDTYNNQKELNVSYFASSRERMLCLLMYEKCLLSSFISVLCTMMSTVIGNVNKVVFLYSEATILTSKAKASVKQSTPVKIDVQYRGPGPQSRPWMKDGQALPSGWTQNAVHGVISISKQNPVYSDIGTYTLNVSTPWFSNPLYQSTTASTTLDVLGKCRSHLLDWDWHFATTFWLFVVYSGDSF